MESKTTAKTPRFVKSISALARSLKRNRTTIYVYLDIEGNPGRKKGLFDVVAWKKWVAATTPKTSENAGLMNLKAEGRGIDNEKEAFKLQVLKKKYVTRAVAKRAITQLITDAKTRSLSGVARLVTLVRLAADNTTATEIATAELLEIWREMERSEWSGS